MSTVGSLIGVLVTFFAVPYILLRVYPNQVEPARSALAAFALCIALLGVVSTVNLGDDLNLFVPRTAYYISHISFPLAILIGGFACEILLQGRALSLKTIVRRPTVIVTGIALAVMLSLLWITPDPISFIRPEAIRPEPSYLGAFTIYYGVKAALMINNTLPLIATLRQPQSPVFRARYLISAIGTAIGPLFLLMMLALPALLPVAGPRYNEPVVFVVQTIGRSAVLLCLLVGFVLPDRIFRAIAAPLIRWLEARDHAATTLIRELHEMMIAVVPSVHLGQVHSLNRMLIEISDARLLLWSQDTGRALRSPQDEASYLDDLQRQGVTIDRWGGRQPTVPQTNVFTYNLAVARQLRRLRIEREAQGVPAPAEHRS